MFIGGLQKLTLIDYPGKMAAVVFTIGCNFRCPYCHNPEIVNPKMIDYDQEIQENEVLDFLKSRRGDLDGVCITGGEPTLQLGLSEFIKKIKEMDFSVKLDTNASNANATKSLTENRIVDYWAIDIKTTPSKYKTLTKKSDILDNIEKSLNYVINSNAQLEFRTTVVPGVVNKNDFKEIIKWINSINTKAFSRLSRYSIQNFRSYKTLDSSFEKMKPYTKEELESIAEEIKKHCQNVVVLE